MSWLRRARRVEPGYLARAVTLRAPHVRAAGDLTGVMRTLLLALVPCLLVGLYNAGYQVSRAVAAGAQPPAGWRGALLDALGPRHDSGAPLACLLRGALLFAPLLASCALTGLACERGFARLRGRRPAPGLALVVALYCLCLPPTLPLWQAALGLAFGLVLGRELFGGTGRNFLHPALVGLVFLRAAYPAALEGPGVWVAAQGQGGASALGLAAVGGLRAVEGSGVTWTATLLGRVPGSFGETSALACLLGGALLVWRGLVSWRVPAGAVLGLVATTLLLQLGEGPAPPAVDLPWWWQLTLGGFAFGAIFLATDPVTAAGTDPGRWIYGFLIGFLVVLIRVRNPVHTEGVAFAILLGNVLAPLIDRGVVQLELRRRRLRHG